MFEIVSSTYLLSFPRKGIMLLQCFEGDADLGWVVQK